MIDAPVIVDEVANARFTAAAIKQGWDPDDRWVGGYVDYEWRHARHVFQTYCRALEDRDVLEFGCNLGASAIVLAHLGARVTAIDVNPNYVDMARLNASRYGVADKIDFRHVADTCRIPFESGIYSMISCNSVLEYVPKRLRRRVISELDRVLEVGGLLLIGGTSNRLWPKEQHSQRWLVNYLPRVFDPLLSLGGRIERGVSPFALGFMLSKYVNEDLEDGGIRYRHSKALMGKSDKWLELMKSVAGLLRPVGVTAGVLLPSFFIALRKTAD